MNASKVMRMLLDLGELAKPEFQTRVLKFEQEPEVRDEHSFVQFLQWSYA
jgi:hypothetical protein